jgi:hypothetical protein
VSIHALGVDGGGWLATHPRATRRGTWVIDQAHWDGLPDGHTRATTTETPPPAISIGSDKPTESMTYLPTRSWLPAMSPLCGSVRRADFRR